MGQIREVLTVEDQFSATFTKFLNLGSQAANASNLAASASQNYQSVLNGLDRRLISLNAQFDTMLQEQERMIAAGQQSTSAFAALDSRMETVGGTIRSLTAQYDAVSKQAEEAAQATRQFDSSNKRAGTSSDSLAGKLKSLLGAYAGFQGVKKLLDLSDTVASTTARLDMMNDGLQTTEELNQMIFESAQRSRGSYMETANFVSKLGNLAGDAFSSNAEAVAFAEQINKQITLSGASSTEASSAIYQLTQGLSAGALRGEELNSVMEQTPMIAQTIADYLGVTTGEMRELASEGKITASVVKNAMFAAAEETNAKFEEMPMTWSQVWTMMQNMTVQVLQPILDVVSQVVQFIGDNLETIMPIIYGIVAAIGAWTIAQGILNFVMAASPLTWIVLAIVAVIGAITALASAVGGFGILWSIIWDGVLYVWDTVKTGFMVGVYWILNLWDQLVLKIQTAGVLIQNFVGDMRVGVLKLLQKLVNGAIDIINGFIEVLNKLPFVEIETIQKATFATTAEAENEAAKQARNADLSAKEQEVYARQAQRANDIANMWQERDANHAARQADIAKRQAEQAAEATTNPTGLPNEVTDPQLEETNSTLKDINKSVSASEEDIKSLVDMAERRYVNNINLTAQTPVITVNGANTGRTAADRQNLANTIRDILVEQAASGSVRTTARAF